MQNWELAELTLLIAIKAHLANPLGGFGPHIKSKIGKIGK